MVLWNVVERISWHSQRGISMMESIGYGTSFPPTLSGPKDNYIFCSTLLNPRDNISYWSTMRKMFLTLAEEAKIPDLNRIRWHSCRKSQADSTLEATGSIDAVRTLLGHTQKSRSTNFYLSSRPGNRPGAVPT